MLREITEKRRSLLLKAGGERISISRDIREKIRSLLSNITPADHGDDHNRHFVNIFSPESSGIVCEKKSDAKSKLEEGASL